MAQGYRVKQGWPNFRNNISCRATHLIFFLLIKANKQACYSFAHIVAWWCNVLLVVCTIKVNIYVHLTQLRGPQHDSRRPTGLVLTTPGVKYSSTEERSFRPCSKGADMCKSTEQQDHKPLSRPRIDVETHLSNFGSNSQGQQIHKILYEGRIPGYHRRPISQLQILFYEPDLATSWPWINYPLPSPNRGGRHRPIKGRLGQRAREFLSYISYSQ